MATGQHLPSRRLVVSAGLLSAAASISGCSIRLERDAPRVPGIPTQAPPPDTAAFQALADRLQAVIAALQSQSHPWAPRLRAVHQQQQARVLAVAASAGIRLNAPAAGPTATAPVATPTPSPTSSAISEPVPPMWPLPAQTPTPTPSYPMSSAAPIEAAGVTAGAIARMLRVTTGNRPMFLAIGATQAAAATLLGGPVQWQGDALPAQVARGLLPSVRAAVYGMEIVAARTPIRDRAVIIASLTTMYAARSRVEVAAGPGASPDSNDYRLPDPVTDAAGMRRLVQHLTGSVVTACAAQALAPRDEAAAAALLRLWSEACVVLWTWGATPAPFPGTTR